MNRSWRSGIWHGIWRGMLVALLLSVAWWPLGQAVKVASAATPQAVEASPYADQVVMGDAASEASHNLQNWSYTETAIGGRTIRYQALRGDSTLTFTNVTPGQDYLLTAVVYDGYCDDSFQIMVGGLVLSDFKSVDGILDRTLPMIVPSSIVTSSTMVVTFRNRATDTCGRAGVYNVQLVSASNTLALATQGPGTAAVTPASADGHYAAGTAVTIVATAQAGEAIFTGWTVDGKDVGYKPTLALTMDRSHNVIAHFGLPLTFCDVKPSDPAYEAIRQLSARGVIRGFVNDANARCFGPDESTLRAQMAALIARPFDWDLETHPNNFTDRGPIDDNLWASIGSLQFYAVAQGYKDVDCQASGLGVPCYGPTDNVLNVQVISFIARAMMKRGYWQAQPDNGTIYPNVLAGSGHRQDVVTYVHYAGAVSGTGATTAPFVGWDTAASRSFFAIALWQALNSYFGAAHTS